MNILKTISNTTDRIPLEYRQFKTLDEIRADVCEIKNITNPHLLNLKSLLFPSSKEIISISKSGKKHTMDLEIDDATHSYYANGTPVHNTINLPKDYPYDDFKNVYIKAYNTGTIKGVTTYRAGTMASVLASKNEQNNSTNSTEERNGHIIRHQAPRRPKSVPCNVHQLTVGGQRWTVFVGLVVDEKEELSPYEVFAFKKKNISLPERITSGTLTKMKSGKYNFTTPDGLELEDIASLFDMDEQQSVTRLISLGLRHGSDIKFIVEQLNKASGSFADFTKAVARTIKSYIKNNETPTGDITCPNCKQKEALIYSEGCVKCKFCDFSVC